MICRVENGPGPTLLLNGHTDTVLRAEGWSCDPWQGKRVGDRFYGLGAADMKSGVAAAMLATRALDRARDRWRGTVIFTSVVDEEAFSIGARALVEMGLRADACIVTEGTWDRPVIGGVGKVLVRAEITGKAAHGSWPSEGINAAVEAAKLIARLDDLPLGHHPRMTATQCVLSFHSGNDQYVITVPEKASFTINRHIVPGETGESVLTSAPSSAGLNSPARFEFAIDPPCARRSRSRNRSPSSGSSPPPTRPKSATRRLSDEHRRRRRNYFAADLALDRAVRPRGAREIPAEDEVGWGRAEHRTARFARHPACSCCADGTVRRWRAAQDVISARPISFVSRAGTYRLRALGGETRRGYA
ncbi:MAG: M20/M25/M40 family metallo-hydrolase [Thermomicrobiales bacterium]